MSARYSRFFLNDGDLRIPENPDSNIVTASMAPSRPNPPPPDILGPSSNPPPPTIPGFDKAKQFIEQYKNGPYYDGNENNIIFNDGQGHYFRFKNGVPIQTIPDNVPPAQNNQDRRFRWAPGGLRGENDQDYLNNENSNNSAAETLPASGGDDAVETQLLASETTFVMGDEIGATAGPGPSLGATFAGTVAGSLASTLIGTVDLGSPVISAVVGGAVSGAVNTVVTQLVETGVMASAGSVASGALSGAGQGLINFGVGLLTQGIDDPIVSTVVNHVATNFVSNAMTGAANPFSAQGLLGADFGGSMLGGLLAKDYTPLWQWKDRFAAIGATLVDTYGVNLAGERVLANYEYSEGYNSINIREDSYGNPDAIFFNHSDPNSIPDAVLGGRGRPNPARTPMRNRRRRSRARRFALAA